MEIILGGWRNQDDFKKLTRRFFHQAMGLKCRIKFSTVMIFTGEEDKYWKQCLKEDLSLIVKTDVYGSIPLPVSKTSPQSVMALVTQIGNAGNPGFRPRRHHCKLIPVPLSRCPALRQEELERRYWELPTLPWNHAAGSSRLLRGPPMTWKAQAGLNFPVSDALSQPPLFAIAGWLFPCTWLTIG